MITEFIRFVTTFYIGNAAKQGTGRGIADVYAEGLVSHAQAVGAVKNL